MASISTPICTSKYFLLLTYLAVVLGINSSRGEDQSLSSPPLQCIDLCQRIEGRKRRALVKLGVCLAFGGLLYRWATFKTRTSFSASSMFTNWSERPPARSNFAFSIGGGPLKSRHRGCSCFQVALPLVLVVLVVDFCLGVDFLSFAVIVSLLLFLVLAVDPMLWLFSWNCLVYCLNFQISQRGRSKAWLFWSNIQVSIKKYCFANAYIFNNYPFRHSLVVWLQNIHRKLPDNFVSNGISYFSHQGELRPDHTRGPGSPRSRLVVIVF